MQDALVKVYDTNPALAAARFQVRAAYEGVDLAASATRPRVTTSASYSISDTRTSTANGSSSSTLSPARIALSVRQSLYRGGRSQAEVKRAEIGVQTARASLAASEQGVLLRAATAYVDVVRDEAVLDLNVNNERVLERQLEATQDRFRVGEVTRTYVSQAESRLARARANRIAAEGRLSNSRADFRNVVGEPIGEVQEASPLADLPASLDESIKLARQNNFNVVRARLAEESARLAVRIIRGELLPEFSVAGELSAGNEIRGADTDSTEASISASISVPLYSSGSVRARLRQAEEVASQRQVEHTQAVRNAVESATASWHQLKTARAQMSAYTAAIEAADIALRGVREEEGVGSRTVLDVLDAEQEYLDARVNLVMAQRDELVGTLLLRQAIGTLTATALALPVKPFEVESHSTRVRRTIWGIPFGPGR